MNWSSHFLAPQERQRAAGKEPTGKVNLETWLLLFQLDGKAQQWDADPNTIERGVQDNAADSGAADVGQQQASSDGRDGGDVGK